MMILSAIDELACKQVWVSDVSGFIEGLHSTGFYVYNQRFCCLLRMFDELDTLPVTKALSNEEALVVSANSGLLRPWHVVGWQIVVTALAGLLVLLVTQELGVAYSLIWGGMCSVIPAALFARGLLSKAALIDAGAAVAGFFMWELLKLALTIAMLFAATQVVHGFGQALSWPALLLGLILAMKAYWVAFWCNPKVSK